MQKIMLAKDMSKRWLDKENKIEVKQIEERKLTLNTRRRLGEKGWRNQSGICTRTKIIKIINLVLHWCACQNGQEPKL